MELFILIFILVLFVISLFQIQKKTREAEASYTPPKSTAADPSIFRHYEACESLFTTRSELAFFHSLSRTLSAEYFVLAKPRLEDVIRVRKNLANRKLAFSLRGRVKSRHVDFLVIDSEGCPLMAIELDGPSHKSSSARAGDELKDGIFAASGLPLRRVKPGQNFADISADIFREIRAS